MQDFTFQKVKVKLNWCLQKVTLFTKVPDSQVEVEVKVYNKLQKSYMKILGINSNVTSYNNLVLIWLFNYCIYLSNPLKQALFLIPTLSLLIY